MEGSRGLGAGLGEALRCDRRGGRCLSNRVPCSRLHQEPPPPVLNSRLSHEKGRRTRLDPPPLASAERQILRHAPKFARRRDLVGGCRRVVVPLQATVLVDIDRHLIALAHRAVDDSGGDGIHDLAEPDA